MLGKGYVILPVLIMLLSGCESSRVVKPAKMTLSKNMPEWNVVVESWMR